MEEFGLETCAHTPKASLPRSVCQNVPHGFFKRHLVLPIKEEGDRIVVAVADPLNIEAIEELSLCLGREIKPLYCKKELLLPALQEWIQEGSARELRNEMGSEEGETQEAEIHDLLETDAGASPAVKLVNVILTEAIQQGASDIHFEPFDGDLRVRYRIDGVLQMRHSPPSEYQAQLIARLKVMARLDIAEHRLPQDGRIKVRMGGREIDIRTSTLPTTSGERIVLRILDRGNRVLDLENLQLGKHILSRMRRMIRMPEGIILVTGPTGSGKSTTLYSCLNEILSEDINIMTIEDPVEYKLPGIAQIGVRPKIGLTFAAGLRHILRQDPDVIMIGEIRDKETAEIAIQSALTGHLVLSTLHTNDAPSAITRLVDMGVEPYLLSSTIIGVLAQRLVRTLCSMCQGEGCGHCFGSGYKGRCGIYELMPACPVIRKAILEVRDASTLRYMAIKEGMPTLDESGDALIEANLTTKEEVLRVTRTGGS